MKNIKRALIAIALIFTLVLSLPPAYSAAQAGSTNAIQCGVNSAAGEPGCDDPTGSTTRLNTIIGRIVNLLTIIIGMAAVIMIMIAGFNYITSGGDSTKVSSAKNSLLYAIIGLVVVAFAQIIVRFILAKTK